MQTMGNWDSYRDDLDALKCELENLIEARNNVTRRIKIAEEEEQQQQMKPMTNEVQLWLTSVQAVETEVDELIKQASEEIDKLHPGGFSCSGTFNTSSSSYELEDMVGDKLQAVTTLINEGAVLVADDQVRVVTTLLDEEAETIPEDVADDQLTTVVINPIFNEVWRCLKTEEEDDDDVGIIGVYGMGGVGKTTLLKQINKKLLLEMNDFDVVIWVVVSRDLKLEKIQQQIGEKIGLLDNKLWRHKNFEDKTSDISKILEEKKFVLLMDDIWEKVDFTKVGVPLPSPENSSKIVFTTHSLEICSLMEADRQFKMKCLAPLEARKLFLRLAGYDTLSFQGAFPENVFEACYGLPLALDSVGRAMASKKSRQERNDLFQVLTRSWSSNSGSDDQLKKSVYYKLKLSYDSLQNDMLKSCLLYCCLFPRNYEISKRDLIDCWIGEGFLDERLGEQSQGCYIIDVLLSTCLLEEGKNEYINVKMHNWIHDMSLWIASEIEKEKGNFFVWTSEAPPDTEKWENVTRMSLKYNTRWNLTDAPPKTPHLQTLFLYSNNLEMISNDFFLFMPCLKVLNFSNNPFLAELPSGISNLVSLQNLNLSSTAIQELPKGLRALKKLKCLNLENTRRLCTIPRELISKFSVLHVLRLWECGFLRLPAEDGSESNAAPLFIEELLCMKSLTTLSITLANSYALQKLLSSNRLQSCTQNLCLRYLQHPNSIKVSLTELKHLNTLKIFNCEYLEELEVDFVGEVQRQSRSPRSFYFLGEVSIRRCPNLQELTWLILAPNLKRLDILNCPEMEEIINVGKLSECPELMGNVIPFSKLKFLTLKHLPNLRSIYWSDLPFPNMERITITDCPKLPTSVASWTRRAYY